MRRSSIRPVALALPPLLLLFIACSSEGGGANPPPPREPPADAGSTQVDADGDADASALPPEVHPTGISTPHQVPGTRLAPLYHQLAGNDGSVKLELRTWFDTERDEGCVFQKMSDGKTRCAPYGEEPTLSRESYFQDAACSMPVIAFSHYVGELGEYCYYDESSYTKRYVRVKTGSRCAATRLARFPTTGRLAVTTVYRKHSDGTCSAFPLGSAPYEVFASPEPLEEIDPSAFLAVTVSDDTPATNMRLRVSRTIHTGLDGSKSISAGQIVDSERNEFCWRSLDENGEHRCMPYSGSVFNGFGYSDSRCTQPAWNVFNAEICDADGRFTFMRYMSRGDVCNRSKLIPRFTSSPISTLYRGTPTSCTATGVPTDPTADYLYYSAQPLPPSIAPSAFSPIAQIERDAPAGYYGKHGSRLSLRVSGDASPDGFEFADSMTFYDRELETSCSIATLTDGKNYCVGAYGWFGFEPSSGVFADAACTDAVAGVSKPNVICGSGSDATTPKFFADRPYSQNGCRTLRLYELGPRHEVQALYSRDQRGECSASYHRASDYDVYRVTELSEVAPSTFVELTSTLSK